MPSSSRLTMALVPSSLLLFLVSSSVWPLPVAAAHGHGQEREHCSPVLCGNVTISFPFGLVQEGAAESNCSAWTGFQVRCDNNTTPYLGSYQSMMTMEILSIFYDNLSLIIADRPPWHPYFKLYGQKGCQIPKDNTFSRLASPFSISPFNQNLIFYNCTKPPSPPGGVDLVDTVCRDNTFVRAVDGRPDESEGSYLLEGCNATMVPVLGVPGKVNASNYEQLVWDGFLATWPPLPGNFALPWN